MSRSLSRFFKPILNLLKPYSTKINKIGQLTLGIISISKLIGHGIYAYVTVENKLIKVNKKYQFE